jgi:flagellar hook assembly protein FlgD
MDVKVWDVHNNSSEDFIEFIVAGSEEFILRRVLNYPNPFTTSTSFFFEHNRPDTDLDIIIQVFTVSGKLVRTIERFVSSTGYRTQPIEWDGLDDFGSRIGRGVYVYRVTVRTAAGETAEKFEKLVILK